jgi:hypothetical protein
MARHRPGRQLCAASLWFGVIVGSAACVPLAPSPTATRTALPSTATATVAFPTLQPSATLPRPPTATATRDVLAGLADLLLFEDFQSDTGWPLGSSTAGAVSLRAGRLVISIRQPEEFRLAIGPAPETQDFYARVDVRAEICNPGDEFGLAFRANGVGEHYRLTISCTGELRLRRVLADESRALLPPAVDPAVFPGAPAHNTLAVWAHRSEFRLYVNGIEVAHARDGVLPSGRIGFFVRAGRAGQATIAFDDLAVYSLSPSARASLSLSP